MSVNAARLKNAVVIAAALAIAVAEIIAADKTQL